MQYMFRSFLGKCCAMAAMGLRLSTGRVVVRLPGNDALGTAGGWDREDIQGSRVG